MTKKAYQQPLMEQTFISCSTLIQASLQESLMSEDVSDDSGFQQYSRGNSIWFVDEDEE